jgi:hypothetical protein
MVTPMRRLIPLLGLAFALSACGGAATIKTKSLGKLVLQQGDLGARFTPFNSGPQTQLDNQGTGRSDTARFGREGGWIARFHRGGSAATRGPLVVESRVDLFRDAGGAKKDLTAYRALLARQPGSQLRSVALPPIGDDAAAVTFVQTGGASLRFYRIVWRYRNATASVTVEGFDGKLEKGDAVALAQKQQARLLHG